MNHIINFRGTNGSGKTTLARAVMKKLKFVKEFITANGVPMQIHQAPSGDFVAVVGRYSAVNGGVDTVHKVRNLVEAVAEVADHAHVVLEGVILSTLQTLTKDIADACHNSEFHVLTLSTPPEQCVAQTLSRRLAKGNEKPFDPERSLLPKVKAVTRAAEVLKEWGMDSRVVSQQEAFNIACEYLQLPKQELMK